MKILYAALPVVTLLAQALVCHGAMNIVVQPNGDGYHHDETGSSYDYFDSSATSNLVHYQYYGTSDTMIRHISYAQFSLAGIDPLQDVGSAYLNLYVTEIHYADDSPSGGNIYHVSNASSATGEASQRLNGSELLVNVKDQPLGWLAIDITDALQSDLDNGYSFSAFSFTPDTTGYFRNAGFSFNSGDAAENQPYVSVTTVPEASSSALFLGLSGALLVAWRRRRTADSNKVT